MVKTLFVVISALRSVREGNVSVCLLTGGGGGALGIVKYSVHGSPGGGRQEGGGVCVQRTLLHSKIFFGIFFG